MHRTRSLPTQFLVRVAAWRASHPPRSKTLSATWTPTSRCPTNIDSCSSRTKTWTDWIDYWSVDFDFESKREIIRRPKEIDLSSESRLPGVKSEEGYLEQWEEIWTGDYIFENEWQSFRTKKVRTLELTSAYHETGKK